MDIGDVVTGCIVGGAIGDGFGSAYEGAVSPVHVDDARDWTLTDDTQLTLATCEAITASGAVCPSQIADQMASWFRDGRVTGLGSSTLKALLELSRGAHWALCGRRGEMAAGNGAAARIAPLAFWLDPTVSSDRQTVRDVARITHHSDEAYAAALAAMGAIRAAGSGSWQGGRGLLEQVRPLLPDTRVRDRLEELEKLESDRPICGVARMFGCSGYAVESVPLAIFAAQREAGLGFGGMLRELIAAGGDTDTIASIAGQVAGARLGWRRLPPNLMARVPEAAAVMQVAKQFAAAVSSKNYGTRQTTGPRQ